MRKKLFFKNNKGDRLCGILSSPAIKKGSPVTILCHGFTTNKGRSKYVRFEEVLNRSNVATFRFDFYGHGESEGKFENITITEAADDVLNAISFLRNLGYGSIGLIGASFGGLAALIAAAKTNQLSVLCLICPVSNYIEKWKIDRTRKGLLAWKKNGFLIHTNRAGEKFKLNYTFFSDAKRNTAYKVAHRVKIPTIIIQGDLDNLLKQSKKTAKLIKNCRLEILKGADHQFSNPRDYDKMISLAADFIIGNS